MDIRDFFENLEPGWERKALIILGVIVILISIYAFNPFAPSPKVETQSGSVNTPVSTTQPAPVVSNNSNASNNNTNVITNSSNGTFQISAEQAKQIALNSNPGFTAGEPSQGSITLNNNVIYVWTVPLMKGTTVSKEVYVDSATGMIVGTKEL